MSRQLLRTMYPQAFEEADRDDRDLGVAVAVVWRRVSRAARAGGGNPADIRVIRTILKLSAHQRSMLEAYKPLANEAFQRRKALANKSSRVTQAEWDRVQELAEKSAPRYKEKKRSLWNFIATRLSKPGAPYKWTRVRYVLKILRPKR